MDDRVSAWNVIREELPKWWNDNQQKDLRDTLGLAVPQSPAELGAMMLLGPGGKAATKVGGLALAGGTYSPDAEAGVLRFAHPKLIESLMAHIKQRMGNPLHTPTASQVANEGGLIPLTGRDIDLYTPAAQTTFLDVKDTPFVSPTLWDKYRGKDILYSSTKLTNDIREGKTLGGFNERIKNHQRKMGIPDNSVGRIHPGNYPTINNYDRVLAETPELADLRLEIEPLQGAYGRFIGNKGPRGTVVIGQDTLHPGKFDVNGVLETLNHEALGHGWLHNYAGSVKPKYFDRKDITKQLEEFYGNTGLNAKDLPSQIEDVLKRIKSPSDYGGSNVYDIHPERLSALRILQNTAVNPKDASLWASNLEEQLARSVEKPRLQDRIKNINYADANGIINNLNANRMWTQGNHRALMYDIQAYIQTLGYPKTQEDFTRMILSLSPKISDSSKNNAIRAAERLPQGLGDYSKKEILEVLHNPYWLENVDQYHDMYRILGIEPKYGQNITPMP